MVIYTLTLQNVCAIDGAFRHEVVHERLYTTSMKIWEASQHENSNYADPFAVAVVTREVIALPFACDFDFTLLFTLESTHAGKRTLWT